MDIPAIKQKFIEIYGGEMTDLRVFTAPGRVNLIGEHIDYCGGNVLPAALSIKTTIVVRKNNDNKIRLAATDLEVRVEADLSDLGKYRRLEWGNYQIGVAYELQQDGLDLQGCDMLFDDTIPHGGGLSSSAAIEVATALCLTTLAHERAGLSRPMDMVKLALVGQRAENNYVGVNCGIMDQFASACGKENHAIHLNCGSLEHKHVPLKLGGYTLVITNTNKKRSLAESKYNERRAEVEQGLMSLKGVLPEIECLADVSVEQFEKNKKVIGDEIIEKRVEHVVHECSRVEQSVQCLSAGDLTTFGKLLNQSHDSLRDLYEVTGIELDTLVNLSREVSGVLGSRMTGAGFGGCTVTLIESKHVDEFTEYVCENYKKVIGYTPSFYLCDIHDGAKEELEELGV